MPDSPSELTDFLVAWSDGDEEALHQLIPLVYGSLRRLAGSFMRHERTDHTLQTIALVHEAYLRLVDQNGVRWRSRAQFFALAAQMMRRILVDHARRRSYAKRGGEAQRVSSDALDHLSEESAPDHVALDEALTALSERNPQLARLVELKYFVGLTKEEIGAVLGLSTATVTRRWRLARAWLYSYLVKGVRDGL